MDKRYEEKQAGLTEEAAKPSGQMVFGEFLLGSGFASLVTWCFVGFAKIDPLVIILYLLGAS